MGLAVGRLAKSKKIGAIKRGKPRALCKPAGRKHARKQMGGGGGAASISLGRQRAG